MGFFDSIKEHLNLGVDEDFYDDDFEEYYDDPDTDVAHDTTGILGNTRRPEAESVSVYTRSGRQVGTNAGNSSAGYGYPVTAESYGSDYRSNYAEPSLTAQNTGRGALGTAGSTTPGDVGLTPLPRGGSAQLPPYIVKPAAYDDVQMVVRRVRTGQPVIIVLTNTPSDISTRILDFAFGFATGIGGKVEQVGNAAFAVTPANLTISQTDLDRFKAEGTI